MKTETFEKILQGLGVTAFKSGSQVICNPPPEGSDHDYFVLDEWYGGALGYVSQLLQERLGFTVPLDVTEYYGDSKFLSLRRGDINVITVFDLILYKRILAATIMARERNLLDKEERVKFFEEVKSSMKYSEVAAVIENFQRKVKEVA